jgi:hypothetical protein
VGAMINAHKVFENLKGIENLEYSAILRWVFEKYCKT